VLAVRAINSPSLLLNPCILLGQAKIFHIISDTVQPSIHQTGLVPPTSDIALSASSSASVIVVLVVALLLRPL